MHPKTERDYEEGRMWEAGSYMGESIGEDQDGAEEDTA
jgi:hypothetical protein